MNEPTRPAVLSSQDIDRIVSALASAHGANIRIQDPRVSKVQTWMLGLVGSGAILSMAWMANSIDNLNLAFARSNVQLEFQARTVENNTRAVVDHEKRLTIIESGRR